MRHLFIVTYDISDRVRWAKVYKTMRGFGEHLQLSVFQCDLTPTQKVRMASALSEIINSSGGPGTRLADRVDGLGRLMTDMDRRLIRLEAKMDVYESVSRRRNTPSPLSE